MVVRVYIKPDHQEWFDYELPVKVDLSDLPIKERVEAGESLAEMLVEHYERMIISTAWRFVTVYGIYPIWESRMNKANFDEDEEFKLED